MSTHAYAEPGYPVVVVYGVAGGVGVTSLVAYLTRRYARRGTAVGVDLDLWTGDLAERMGVREQPSTTIADLAAVSESALHASHVRTVVWGNPDREGEVVPSPAHPELAEIVSASHVTRLIEELRMQGAVIVDAGSRCDERTLAACTLATAIVVCARSRAALKRRSVHELSSMLERAGVDPRRMHECVRVPIGVVRNWRAWAWLQSTHSSEGLASALRMHRGAWEGVR